MKVALLTNFIPPYRKGLLEKLAKNVSKLTVLVSTEMEKNRDWKTDHGALDVEVQKTWSYTKNWKNENGYPEKSIVHIPRNTLRLLKKMNPDVVVSSELGIRSLMASMYCKRRKKPLILWLTLSERTETSRKGIRTLLRKRLLKSASAVLGNGSSCERYIRSMGYDKEVFFVPYTIDLSENESELSVSQERLTLLCVGQLIKRKGIEEMVNAFATWSEHSERSIRLLVAGDGPERDQLNKLHSNSNIDLEILGSVEYEKLGELYRRADIMVFPTLGDEWGVVVNEALANHVPVMGSMYSQAVEELIVDGENGWLFYPDKKEEFVSVLDTALSTSPEKLLEMKRSCSKTLRAVSVELAVENFARAIQQCTTE
ncbi:MAG: glycosyltransferase family 4 protein [Crocinitomicaceae bacterium]